MTSNILKDNSTPRIHAVDALRGFAVFGILISHCYFLFFLGDAVFNTTADTITETFVSLFVNDKFYSLFSFLFGLSFSLMLTRTNENTGTFYLRFAWRLILLGMIGVLHNLHWNDDILSIYAVLGFLLLLLSPLDNRIILVIAVLLLCNVPGFFIRPPEYSPAEEVQINATYSTFLEAMKNGSYPDTIKANISVFVYKLDYYLYSGRFSFMMGYFLLGMVAGKKKLFHNYNRNPGPFKNTFILVGVAAIILTVIGFLFHQYKDTLPEFIITNIRYFRQSQSILLTLTYISGMMIFFSRQKCRFITNQFAVVGKMALTNYVLHSVPGTLLLCGYGFGLLHYPLHASIATLTALPLFIIMILFSNWWLKKFSNGPLEWLWRKGIYLFRKSAKNTVQTVQ